MNIEKGPASAATYIHKNPADISATSPESVLSILNISPAGGAGLKHSINSPLLLGDQTEPEIRAKARNNLLCNSMQQQETLSFQTLSSFVKRITVSSMLLMPKSKVHLLHFYCAARLWSDTGLIQEETAQHIADTMDLSDLQSSFCEVMFRATTEPWVSGQDPGGKWVQNVLELMQDELLGRFF